MDANRAGSSAGYTVLERMPFALQNQNEKSDVFMDYSHKQVIL